jgi:hypothetical protein
MQFLTVEQKQQCVSICEDLHQFVFGDATFLLKVITGNESWVYCLTMRQNINPPNEKSEVTVTEKDGTGEDQSKEHAHNFFD